ncbi:hypothetical protein EYF80_014414 [Liparis tanakae]|uniref:Uncharacterized protein n=1 Tax=Liparis tanakae TaxID=230148 RepID=A0A4Z2IBL2_9TELE|nr:hypothetical protein EYF80_014414 [Liparis tanakae]
MISPGNCSTTAAARCCAPVSPAAPLHDGRLRSLEQSQWLPAVSDGRNEEFSGRLRVSPGGEGQRSKGKRRKRGRNTIKMSCTPTDQSLPTSHVQPLTWLPDKWRLEERRRKELISGIKIIALKI